MHVGRISKYSLEERNAEIKKLAKEGFSVTALAKKFNICEEYVTQIIDGGLDLARRQAIRAAKDFCYGDEVIAQIKGAKSSDEISEIMSNARKAKFG